MEVFLFLFTLVGLWFLLAPMFILSKISNAEERLKKNIEDSISSAEKRLKIHIEESIKSASLQEPEVLPLPNQSVVSQEIAQPAALVPDAVPVSAALYKMTEEALRSLNKEIKQDNLEQVVGKNSEPTNFEATSFEPASFEPVKIEPTEVTPEMTKPAPVIAPDRQKMAESKDAPGIFEKFFSWLLAEGNIWVCAGVLLLFIGFGLLLRHAIQIGFLTLEMRLAAAAFSGMAMTAVGFRLREWRRTYALILQGGGMECSTWPCLGRQTLSRLTLLNLS